MSKKRAIISLGTESYMRGRERLRSSLEINNNFVGSVYLYGFEHEVHAPSHKENPYAFKVCAFEEIKRHGFEQILWVDCSVWAIKNVMKVFEVMDADGYICQEAGHMVGTWTNDRALDYFGVSRDEAMNIMMYGNAGFLGLDFTTEIANEFFNKWKQSMMDGMFKGEWSNNDKTESQDERCMGHRHDMSCGSIIRHQLGMKLQSGQDYLQYVTDDNKVPNNDSVCFFAQGLA